MGIEQFTFPQEIIPGDYLRSAKAYVYSLEVRMRTQETRDLLKEKLQGQVLLDLGAGEGIGYTLFAEFGIEHYVAVEPFNHKLTAKTLKNKTAAPYTIWNADMLSALRNTPDGTVSILTSGIDMCVIEDSKYIENVEDLICKKLHPEGVFINWASTFRPDLKSIHLLGDSLAYNRDAIYVKK